MKNQTTDWEKMFVIQTSKKGLVSRLYKKTTLKSEK